jgi:hypothetical protein
MAAPSPKVLEILKNIANEEIDSIVDKFLLRFDDEIVPLEDPEDPAKPSLCRDEFKEFLKETLEENIKIVGNSIEIGIGDEAKLGFGEDLSEETTDCLRIIGTILQGISGNYVLVTKKMSGEPEGRFGKAFLLPVDQYKLEAERKGWDPNKPIWKFSNFEGIPGFFEEADLSDVVGRITEKFGKALGG